MGKRTRRWGAPLILATTIATVGLVSVTASSAPTTGFSVADLTVVEGNVAWQDVKVRVTRSGPITAAASVKISTTNGSARSGTDTDGGDYRAVSAATVSFGANIAAVNATIRVYADTVPEANEVFNAVLSAPSGAAIMDGLAAVTITNDDAAVPQGFSVGDAVGAENTTVAVPVYRSGPTDTSASVTVASGSDDPVSAAACPTIAAGCDFQQLQTTLAFAPNELVKLVSIKLFSDSLTEGNESFEVTLSGATGAALADDVGRVTIVSPQVIKAGFEVGDTTLAEGSSGTRAMSFTVTRSGSTVGPASIRWTAVVGTATTTDFVPVTTPVQLAFADGERAKTITVTINGDAAIEPNETFTVKLSSPNGSPILDGTGIGTIFNDD